MVEGAENQARRSNVVEGSPPPRKRREGLIFCGVILLSLLGGLAFLNPYLDSDGDNAGYLILAKSIATGQGFTSIHFPEYIPHTQYLPLYPLVLAPIVAAWPGNFLLPKLPSLLFTAVFVAAIWALFRRRTQGSLLTLGLLTASVALNRHVAEHAAATMTEALYLAASYLALVWAEKRAGVAGARDGVILGILLAAAYMTKPIGVTLVAAVLLAWLLQKRWAAFLVAAIIVLTVSGGWSYRTRTIVTPETRFENPTFGNVGYLGHVFSRSAYRSDAGRMGPVEFLERWPRRVISNFDRIARIGHPGYTVGITAMGVAAEPPLIFSIPFILLILVGWVRCLRGGPGAVELYMLLYLGAVTVYPAVRVRYVLSIMPLALYYLVRGTDVAIAWMRRRRSESDGPAGWGGLMVLVSAVVLSFFLVIRQGWFTWQDNFGPRGAQNLYDRVDYGSGAYFRAAKWLGANADPDAVIMGIKPWLAYLVADRKTTVFPFSYSVQAAVDVMRRHRVDYVIEDRHWFWQTRDFLMPVLDAYPEAFKVVHTESDPHTRVYRLDRSALPPPETQ